MMVPQEVLIGEHGNRFTHGVVIIDSHQHCCSMSVFRDLDPLVRDTRFFHQFGQLGSNIRDWEGGHVQNYSVNNQPASTVLESARSFAEANGHELGSWVPALEHKPSGQSAGNITTPTAGRGFVVQQPVRG